jgi:hypothetical protein
MTLRRLSIAHMDRLSRAMQIAILILNEADARRYRRLHRLSGPTGFFLSGTAALSRDKEKPRTTPGLKFAGGNQ